MKHTLDELLDIVYRYYPRGVGIVDGDLDVQAIRDSEEHARLVTARRQAAADERWYAMLRRIADRVPGMLQNHSLHLPTGALDACYSFTISPPRVANRQELWFQVSFLAPYYIIFSSRLIESDIVAPVRGFKFIFQGMQFHVPRSAAGPELMLINLDDESTKSVTIKERDITVTFDLSSDERPYAEWIAREIETTFGCERMPQEIGTVLVPDVSTDRRTLGEARLYDCLFSDDHQWVKPPASEVRATSVEIDTSRLTDRFIAVLTVLAALYHIMVPLMPETLGPFYWGAVKTDGVLHKEEVLKILAKIRLLLDPPVTPRGIAAKRELEAALRELEALVPAWDGDGAPSDAMVAWASSFLANWVVDESSE
jgi:hypothetical protein